MMRFIRYLLVTLLVMIVLFSFVFTSFNTDPVNLWLIRDFGERPLGQWIILAFTSGGLIGLILGYGLFKRIKSRLRIRHLEKKLRDADQEISMLRERSLKEIK